MKLLSCRAITRIQAALIGVIVIVAAIGGVAVYYATRPAVETIHLIWVAEEREYQISKELLDDFEREYGIKVISEEYEYETLCDKMFTAMSAHTGEYDIVQIDYTKKAYVVENGWVTDLTDWIERDADEINIADVAPSIIRTHCKWKGKWWGLPLHVNGMLFFYRTDVFDKYGYELPKTWEDVYTIAKDVTERGDPDCPYGLSIMARKEVQLMCTYTNFVASYGSYWYDLDCFEKTGKTYPTMKTPGNLQAMNMILKLLPYCVPGVTGYGYDENQMAFAMGKAAMCLMWSTARDVFVDPAKSNVVGKWDIVPDMPGAEVPETKEVRHTGALGGWALMIPVDSKHKEAAWKFIKWAVSYDTEMKLLDYMESCRLSILTDPEVQRTHPNYKAYYGLVSAEPWPWGTGSVAFPIIPTWPEMCDLFLIKFSEVLIGTTTPELALDYLQTEYERILKEGGIYTPPPSGA